EGPGLRSHIAHTIYNDVGLFIYFTLYRGLKRFARFDETGQRRKAFIAPGCIVPQEGAILWVSNQHNNCRIRSGEMLGAVVRAYLYPSCTCVLCPSFTPRTISIGFMLIGTSYSRHEDPDVTIIDPRNPSRA